MKHLIALPFLFSACLVPFEMGPLHKAQAAAASPSGAPSLAMSPSDCESLDRERVILSSIAAGLGAVGGGAAIPLPITDDKVGRTAEANVPTTFSDADQQPFRRYTTDPTWAGGTELRDEKSRSSSASASELFAAVCALGGDRGWHRGEWLWKFRGFLDQMWGGPGLRRGRRHPTDLRVGDYVDFWRVVEIRENEYLKLRAEMRLPGDAWLEWLITPSGTGHTITQTARFKPLGLWGRLYWYGVLPFHFLIFPGLLQGIVRDAESGSRSAY